MAYIAVVGALNIDIIGAPLQEPLPGDSSPGRVKISAGGVARNIARSLVQMGETVQLIAPVGRDAFGAFARADCAALRIGLEGALPAETSCRYLGVNGPEGDLRLAVNDMAAMALLTPEALEARLPLILGASLLVLDANLRPDALEYAAQKAACPVVADPVSAPKAARLAGVMPRLTAVKPNRAEAAALTGLSPDAPQEALAGALRAMGATHVYLSLGASGIAYLGPDGGFTAPGEATRAVNFNGCGDAVTAAVAHGLKAGLPPREIARLAMRSAARQALET